VRLHIGILVIASITACTLATSLPATAQRMNLNNNGVNEIQIGSMFQGPGVLTIISSQAARTVLPQNPGFYTYASLKPTKWTITSVAKVKELVLALDQQKIVRAIIVILTQDKRALINELVKAYDAPIPFSSSLPTYSDSSVQLSWCLSNEVQVSLATYYKENESRLIFLQSGITQGH